MSDEKKNQISESQKINEIKRPQKVYDRDIIHSYEIGEQRNKNFSLQFKTEDTPPPTVSTSSTDDDK